MRFSSRIEGNKNNWYKPLITKTSKISLITVRILFLLIMGVFSSRGHKFSEPVTERRENVFVFLKNKHIHFVSRSACLPLLDRCCQGRRHHWNSLGFGDDSDPRSPSLPLWVHPPVELSCHVHPTSGYQSYQNVLRHSSPQQASGGQN